MLWSKIVPFPLTANITESGGSGQKLLTNSENPKIEVFCRTCHFKAKIIKTKCFGRNSPSRAKLLNLRCNVHKYFSQIVVSRSKKPQFWENTQRCLVWLEKVPILGENPKIGVLRSTMQHLRLKPENWLYWSKIPH